MTHKFETTVEATIEKYRPLLLRKEHGAVAQQRSEGLPSLSYESETTQGL